MGLRKNSRCALNSCFFAFKYFCVVLRLAISETRGLNKHFVSDKCKSSPDDFFFEIPYEINKKRGKNNSEFLSISIGNPLKKLTKTKVQRKGKDFETNSPACQASRRETFRARTLSKHSIFLSNERHFPGIMLTSTTLSAATMAARHLIRAIARTWRARPRFRVFRRRGIVEGWTKSARAHRTVHRINYSLFTSECSKR